MSHEKKQVTIVKEDKVSSIADRLLNAVIETGVPPGEAKTVLIKAANVVGNVTPQAVYQWYNKGATPTGELTALICRHFGFNVMWILTGDANSGNCAINYDMTNINNSDFHTIDRLCDGIKSSGAADVKVSLLNAVEDLSDMTPKNALKWLEKKTEPSYKQIANLCEHYGIAQRYVSLGLGPIMTLDYVRQAQNDPENHREEVVNLKDIPLLGNG